MTRVRTADPEPGIAAAWPSQCPRCDGPIVVGARIYFDRGAAVHVTCAPGASDE